MTPEGAKNLLASRKPLTYKERDAIVEVITNLSSIIIDLGNVQTKVTGQTLVTSLPPAPSSPLNDADPVDIVCGHGYPSVSCPLCASEP